MPVRSDAEIAFPEIVNNAQVRHPQFGVGRVMLRTGTDEKSKAIVRFKEEGEKKLALRFANLTVDKAEEEPTAEGEGEGEGEAKEGEGGKA